MNPTALLIFDFCGTIVYPKNTTKEFLKYLHSKRLINFVSYYQYWLLASILVRLRLLKRNQYMEIRVKSLKNMEVKKFEAAIEDFVNSILIKNINQNVCQLLKNPTPNKKIIVSYGLDVIISSFLNSQTIFCNIYASSLEIFNGRLTGRYSQNLQTMKKSMIVTSNFEECVVKNSIFYTDDYQADIDLIEIVNESIII